MDLNSLTKQLMNFWTAKKCGKHKGMAKQHGMLLLKDLVARPKDLFDQIGQNTFTFKNFGKIQWSEFLSRANLAEYLKPEYVADAMDVTSTRPAIGRGEFLFASCFSNIGFAQSSGDLIDLTSGAKVEFKGIRSTMSGDGKYYRQMNRSLLYSVFALFNTSTQCTAFNRECADELDKLLAQEPNKIVRVLTLLQNIATPDDGVAKVFAKLYAFKPDIFYVVGAMQLSLYMRHQKASFLVMTDKQCFCCYAAPKDAISAYNIVKSLKLSSWNVGNRAMTIGI